MHVVQKPSSALSFAQVPVRSDTRVILHPMTFPHFPRILVNNQRPAFCPYLLSIIHRTHEHRDGGVTSSTPVLIVETTRLERDKVATLRSAR